MNVFLKIIFVNLMIYTIKVNIIKFKIEIASNGIRFIGLLKLLI